MGDEHESTHEEALARERAARAEAEQALKRAELFIAILGHELRNPLTSIIAAAQLLDETVDEEADHQLVRRVEANARRIERMADQLLDLGRIRSGEGIVVYPEACDVAALVERCRNEVCSGRTADVTIRAHGACAGVWDGDRLKQLFSNLIDNAIEHSRPEARTVVVTVDGDDETAVRVCVQNPTTIPADVLPLIFAPFQRGSARSRPKGLGLGLYISREVVIAHGGSILVQSTEDAGTTVIVSLPRALDAESPTKSMRCASTQPAGETGPACRRREAG